MGTGRDLQPTFWAAAAPRLVDRGPTPPNRGLRLASSRSSLDGSAAALGADYRMGSDHVEKGRRWSQWMAQAQDGAHTAYGQLLKDCTPFIRAMVRRRMFQPDQAEDVVQDVLL